MIKNIVFDMGNVMIYFNGAYFVERAGITDENDRKLLINEIYKSIEWASMDRGTLTPAQAEEIMKQRIPERLHNAVTQLVSNWDRPIVPVPGMAELVRELKENGYGIYLLSNAATNQPDYWSKVPGSEYFDGTLISAFVKLIKPDLEIYDLFLKKFSLRADECIFIDDSIVNAEAATLAGMSGIAFHDDVGELRQKLVACGVKVSA